MVGTSGDAPVTLKSESFSSVPCACASAGSASAAATSAAARLIPRYMQFPPNHLMRLGVRRPPAAASLRGRRPTITIQPSALWSELVAVRIDRMDDDTADRQPSHSFSV